MFAKLGVHIAPCDDTMLMSYTLDGTSHGNGMDELSRLLLNHETIKYDDVTGTGKARITFDRVPLDKATNYAAEDADVTARFYHILKPRLARESMAYVYEDIERPLIPVIATMEMTGIKVDPMVLKTMSNDFGKKLVQLETDIHALAGAPFNVGSPKQIGEVLFDQMGLEGGTKTKTGQWSTDVDVLEKLAAQGHDIVKKILEWRGLSKLKSTYTDALQEQINPKTKRVHTSFSMAGTSTGRLSSSDPNLQNIPIRTEEGRKIREAFIAEDGCVLLSVDYSQVELRLAAEMADVKALKQAFRDGVDIHALTAAQVFGVPLEEVGGDLRRQAKAVNFGIIYGISGWGLSQQLGCEPGEANAFIKRYLDTFSEIRTYMDRTKDEARKNGYVKTLLGRKCYIPNINAPNAGWRAGAERQAINAPLQGTAADIMKRAMIKIPPALLAANLKAKMLLQVHDELIFEVPEAELEETTALVKSIMENVVALDVPLVAEAGHGGSWASAH
jgi:DNA polymerase-1